MGKIHGDLHTGNVLRDPEGQVWIIDFDTMLPGHVFFDLAKFFCAVLFLHGPVNSTEDVVHMRNLVRLLATVPKLDMCLPDPPSTSSSSVSFAWSFAALMLDFFHGYSCYKDVHMEDCQFQFAWSFLFWSLQMVTYAQNRHSPQLKQLALYAAVAFATQIRGSNELPWVSMCHSDWKSAQSRVSCEADRTRTAHERRTEYSPFPS